MSETPQKRASCASDWHGQADWFPERTIRSVEARNAIVICRWCPVAAECLALAQKIEGGLAARDGIYAGMTPDDRHALWGDKSPKPLGRPTDQERRDLVRRLHATGMTDPMIAEETGIRRDTVAHMRSRMLLPSNAHLHRLPTRNGRDRAAS